MRYATPENCGPAQSHTSQCICYPVPKYFLELNQKLNVPPYHHIKKVSIYVRTYSVQSGSYNVELVRRRLSKLLEKYCSGLWMSKLSELYRDMFSENLHPRAVVDMEEWKDVCMVSYTLCVFSADLSIELATILFCI